jgi:DNA-3-methyladenine glycosylase I
LKVRSLSRSYCIQVLKQTFVFTGGEIVKEFLVSSGYLPGAHDHECPVYWQVAKLQPAWTRGLRHAALTAHDTENEH